jgi:membrane protein DedA with SNARE-associated domain
MSLGILAIAAVLAAAAVIRREHITRSARCVLSVIVVALIVAGSGLVQFPTVTEMVRDGTDVLGDLTYLVVGAFAFAESGAFVGLVAPGEIIVVLGGVTAGHGTIALPTLIIVVWACALSGDLVAYTLGRRFGRGLLVRHGAAFGVTDERLDRVEAFLHKHGPPTILVGRFIGLVRALAPFVAGASKMRASRFIPVAVVASGVWAATFCCLGYVFWRSLDTLIPLIERGSIVLAVAAAVTMLVIQLRRRQTDQPAPRR